MSEWISVKDRLPQSSDDVLMCTKGSVVAIGFYSDAHKWINRSHIFNSDITHWMPLPAPAVQ